MKRSTYNAGARQFNAGLALHEAELPAVIAVCTVPEIANLYAISAARQQAFQEARDGKRQAFIAQRTTREAGRAFIEKARDVLVPFLGSDWSESWAQAGFTSATLAVPQAMAKVVDVLDSLERYFKKNPTRQNAEAAVTEALAKKARENLEVAISTVTGCKRAQRTNRDLRENADTALNDKLACGRKVLAAVLPEDDARWLDFRADVPGDLDRPEAVEGVQGQPGAAGHITVSWPAATRAERYVVQVFVEGVDTAFRNVATVQDTAADVSVTPGARVQVRIIARNASGPTVPSETVNATATVAAVAAVA